MTRGALLLSKVLTDNKGVLLREAVSSQRLSKPRTCVTMDILLDGISYPSESIADKKKMTQKPSKNAPIELVSEFLLKVNAGEIKEAQVLCNAILKYEPDNAMMKDYQVSMAEYVRQGLDEDDDSWEDDDEGDEDGGSADSKGDDDDEDYYGEGKDDDVAERAQEKGSGDIGRDETKRTNIGAKDQDWRVPY